MWSWLRIGGVYRWWIGVGGKSFFGAQQPECFPRMQLSPPGWRLPCFRGSQQLKPSLSHDFHPGRGRGVSRKSRCFRTVKKLSFDSIWLQLKVRHSLVRMWPSHFAASDIRSPPSFSESFYPFFAPLECLFFNQLIKRTTHSSLTGGKFHSHWCKPWKTWMKLLDRFSRRWLLSVPVWRWPWLKGVWKGTSNWLKDWNSG